MNVIGKKRGGSCRILKVRNKHMLNQWPKHFPGCEPVGYSLRSAFPARWVRFHSLPESKRYPEDEDEFATLLDRHNKVLSELVGSDRTVTLLTTTSSGSPVTSRREPVITAFDPTAQPWRVLAMHDLEPNDWDMPTYWHVLASEWEWEMGQFDPLIRKAATWEIVNVMMVDPDCRWLFAPYDGGMDVIQESTEARDRLKAGHRDWLSTLPSGM